MASALLFASCAEEFEPAGSLENFEASKTYVALPAGGGSDTVLVNAKVDWKFTNLTVTEAGDTVIVDNQERQVKVIKQGSNSPLVLNEGISLETTWFIMQGEFNFTSETSNVYQVEYYEKR